MMMDNVYFGLNDVVDSTENETVFGRECVSGHFCLYHEAGRQFAQQGTGCISVLDKIGQLSCCLSNSGKEA